MSNINDDLQALVDILVAADLKLGTKSLQVLPYYPNKPPYPPYISIAADEPFVVGGQRFGTGQARWVIIVTADARDANEAQRQLYAITADVMNALLDAHYPVTNVSTPLAADNGNVPTAEMEISTFHNFDLRHQGTPTP